MTNCIFCKIANKEIPAEIVLETETIIAFKDINPQAPIHLLVIPKQHLANHLEIANFDLLAEVGKAINRLAKDFNLTTKGFRVVNNCKDDGGQEVSHIHWHLLGGRPMKWPPG